MVVAGLYDNLVKYEENPIDNSNPVPTPNENSLQKQPITVLKLEEKVLNFRKCKKNYYRLK